MAPAASLFYSWDEEDGAPTGVTLDCLLPTGVIVPLKVEKDDTLSEIKEKLWKVSQTYPLASSLKGKNTYIFMCIDQRAEKVELWDEQKRLSEVKPFQPMLRVVDRPGNKDEKIMNSNISYLIGKGLHEFDRMKSSEVNDFRINMRKMAKDISMERERKEWESKLQYLFPPEIATTPDMPAHLRDKLINNNFLVSIRLENSTTVNTIIVPAMSYAIEVIDQVLQKRINTGHHMDSADKYILKICGKQEYLLDNYPLCQYQYLRKMVMKGDIPQLLLVDKFSVLPPSIPARARPSLHGERPSPHTEHSTRPTSLANGHSIWSPEAGNKLFTIQIEKFTNIPFEDGTRLILKAGLYHGSGNLCPLMSTHEFPAESGWVDWHESLTFDIALENIPRAAKLCFALYSIYDRQMDKQKEGKSRNNTVQKKAKQRKQELRPVAWVNIPIFDYRDMMHSGHNTLYLWPVEDEDMLTEELVNPIGTVECSPDALDAIALSFTFDDYGFDGPIYYPPFSKVLEMAAKHTNFKETDEVNISDPDNLKRTISLLQLPVDKEKHLEQLRMMLERDPLTPLHEQEIELIWLLRYECQFHYPSSLPKLLSCVQWNNYVDVAQMQALLQIWPELPPTEALELLDFAYADKTVRKYAVQCLKNMSDSELCQYLLQLVQVLKYEPHMDSDLVEFLLRRALMNQRIGHFLFWLLRSEMHVPSVSVRFGLILEAYCHGNPAHMKILTRQVQALERLRNINKHLKDKQFKDLKAPGVKEKALQAMRAMVNQLLYSDVLKNIHSALDPSLVAGNFKTAESKFMDSKMRPLWCVWQNKDPYGPDIFLMYKNGDDLRQDMLTLQIINIMDTIWQEEGLDLRLNAYGCLPTSYGEGVIEIVLNSNTLANIQKKYGTFKVTSGFNKESLLRWLKEHNTDPYSLKKAVEEFTLSCAGYCVATYVLGIGDRHSDNILLKENGQLFHIDFGHVLGHFKSKFGVKRERVPFVLTTDFVHVITQGDANQNPFPGEKDNFKRFGKICEVAYLALRKKANFLITLFMMMMNTGIPEISTIKDIKYLQDTLVPHLTEDEALKQFRQKFKEALQQSWKTSLNWSFHNMAKDNK